MHSLFPFKMWHSIYFRTIYMQNSLWMRDIPPSRSDVFSTNAILIRHWAGEKGRVELVIVMIDYFGGASWTIRGIWTWKFMISLLFIVLTSSVIILTTSISNRSTIFLVLVLLNIRNYYFCISYFVSLHNGMPQIVKFLPVDDNIKK
jgi:hypothetical protein